MSSLLKKLDISKFKDSLQETYKRFLVSTLLVNIVFAIFIIRIFFEDLSREMESLVDKGLLALIVTFFLSIGLYLVSETYSLTKIKTWFGQGLSLLFGLLYYCFFEENLFNNFHEEIIVYIILTLIGVISLIFFAPFIKNILNKKLKQKEFYFFSYDLSLKISMAFVVGISSMILGFIGLSSVFMLFDLSFLDEGKLFGYWASFSLSLLAPIFLLANIPSVEVSKRKKAEVNKFYSFLVNYISLPFIFVYFIILYSYTIKVLMNFGDWPNGEISWMVIGFSFFGYLVYFDSYIFAQKNKIITLFRKVFPISVIPQVAMLFYAISLRLNQYDLTINRYLVVVFGVWLLLISLYFIFSHKKYLGAIPISLVVFTIVMSVGPWSIYLMPEVRQHDRLVSNLESASILQNGEVVSLHRFTDISAELSGEIYEGIYYLCEAHGCDSINDIFTKELSEIKAEDIKKFEDNKNDDLEILDRTDSDYESRRSDIEGREYYEMSNWAISYELSEKIKVRRNNNFTKSENKYISFSTIDYGYDSYIDVSEYDVFIRLSMNAREITEVYGAYINSNEEQLYVYEDNKLLSSFPLSETYEKLLKDLVGDSGTTRLNELKEQLSFYLENDEYEVHLVLGDLSVENPEYKEEPLEEEETNNGYNMFMGNPYNSGYILLKNK